MPLSSEYMFRYVIHNTRDRGVGGDQCNMNPLIYKTSIVRMDHSFNIHNSSLHLLRKWNHIFWMIVVSWCRIMPKTITWLIDIYEPRPYNHVSLRERQYSDSTLQLWRKIDNVISESYEIVLVTYCYFGNYQSDTNSYLSVFLSVRYADTQYPPLVFR